MDDRINNAPCGYIAMTHEGFIQEVNHTFLMELGYPLIDVLHKHIESFMSTANKLIFHSYFYPFIHLNGHVDELFISLKDCSGNSIPYLLNGRRLERDGVEVFDCILMQMGRRVDYEHELRAAKHQMEEAYKEKETALAKLETLHAEIEKKQAELLEMNALLLEMSHTDKLTGLKNRRYFQEALDELIQGYPVDHQPFSLFILDIDHFKRVNDTYGHQIGDDVLERLGSILKSQARKEDIAARYGGEEFVLLLPQVDRDESTEMAENLRHIVACSIWETASITVSIGIATYTQDDTSTSLLKKADKALYLSKEMGRNRVTHAMDLS
ncbi:sensor domain-containing diguanylate cyclase [Paenibacillus aquistagni]|uniref:sensor domain-containing diguanylate cyclase n=1 Tax=Paenibacillus aquistagni TaxID=1852522 RepID=UPI000B5134CF|nr:diguanylate cyclase [Paenibacillus aquistagni]